MKVLARLAALTGVAVTAFGALPALPAGAVLLTPESATDLGLQLESPGVYLDEKTGRMVVTVTNNVAASRVRTRGAIPRVVPRDKSTLDAAAESLDDVRIAGTSWRVDPVTNKVVISVDSSVTDVELARVRTAAARLGGAAHIERVPGVYTPHIGGGDAIYGGNLRCSLAFNVHDRVGKSFFLTAGHCAQGVREFYADPARRKLVGRRSSASYPGDDYAIYHFIRGHTSNFGVINNPRRDITKAGNPYVGQWVHRTGSTTGTRSGRVTAVNVTVNYPVASGSTAWPRPTPAPNPATAAARTTPAPPPSASTPVATAATAEPVARRSSSP